MQSDDEKQEITAALDHHKEMEMWEKNISLAFWLTYLLAAGIWIFSSIEPASPFFLMALALFIAKMVAARMEVRRRITAIRLINSFKRKHALPFYNDLREKFSDQPHIQISLDDDGTIQIRDRKIPAIKEQENSK